MSKIDPIGGGGQHDPKVAEIKQAQNLCITAWVKQSQTKFYIFKQIETQLNRFE